MSNLKADYYHKDFTHIYIEKEALNYPETQRILKTFPHSERIIINHYKDVFCRKKQDFHIQKNDKQLILAVKKNNLIYRGAPVCQSFEHVNFFYTSSIMNCMYDCEYCYLQGMYPSANIVIFVNLEDIFAQVRQMLKQHDVYLCVSYDTDLAAFEKMTGYTNRWIAFVRECNQTSKFPLTIEIRTKSAHQTLWKEVEPDPHIILAYTLSPAHITEQYEHMAPTLQQRIESIQVAIQNGYRVRLCFDPIIYCKDWKEQYQELVDEITHKLDCSRIVDLSIGSFRVSQDYLKKMRKDLPNSDILAFPFCNEQGVYHYPDELAREMIDYMKMLLSDTFSQEQIFVWEP